MNMSEKANIIIMNAKILTMDPQIPYATSIAIRGNKIIAVGDFHSSEYSDSNTDIINGNGNTVVPGFIDSHVHLFGGSAELSCLNVSEINGLESLKQAVQKEIIKKPNESLIYAVCASYHILGYEVEITRHALDIVCPDLPFAMMAADHHTVSVSYTHLTLPTKA